MLSNHSNKGPNHMKGGSRKGYKPKTGQVFQGYEAYKPPFNKANFKPPYPNKFPIKLFQTPTNNPGRSKQTSSTTRNGRAAAKQMIKAHAATTKEKLKTSTRTTTKLLELQQTLPNQSRDR